MRQTQMITLNSQAKILNKFDTTQHLRDNIQNYIKKKSVQQKLEREEST